ncbi:MAG: ATP-binding protein [Euryarchaeota archaeon]|nr:ATP-binding protein [Euryarchaeota archaeon]
MKFYDREKEMEILRRAKRVAIIGRRRVGKTRLVEETLQPITLFIPGEKNEAIIAREWVDEIKRKRYIPESLSTMKDVVEFLMREGETIFIDELQNAMKVNPSFLYDLQRLLDKYRDARVVVTGSLISMSKKMIESYRAPLYGRFDYTIKLRELDFRTVYEIMRDLGYGIEDAVVMWSVFGGLPKYYETLEHFQVGVYDFIRMMFYEEPYPMLSEVMLMLKEELGKEYKTYFSILQAIADGNYTIGEIAGYMGVRSTDISKYMAALLNDYELITRRKNAFDKGKYRYYIAQNLIDFWFRTVWKNYYKFETKEVRFSEEDVRNYVGRKYEALVEQFIPELLPFSVKSTGKYWGKYLGKEKGKESFEVDILAVGEKDIALVEVKWSEMSARDIQKEMEKLKKRAEAIKDDREKHLILVAKKAKKMDNVYDLNDIELQVSR